MKSDYMVLKVAPGLLLIILAACGRQPTIPPEAEAIIFFAEQTRINPGECTFLRWDVKDGYGVNINGEQVDKSGEREVCLAESQIFQLSVDMGTHLEVREVEIAIAGDDQNQGAGEAQPTEPGLSAGFPPEIHPGVPAYTAGTWVVSSGPPGGLGYDIRMDPRNPDVMYVTDAWAGAFKSTDGGKTWFPINNGITARVGPSGDGIPVFSLTIDPNNPDTIWAGTQFGGGVFRSDDSGQNWRSLGSGIQERALTIRGLTVEPGNSNVVYLAGEISSWEWNNTIALPGLGLDMTKGAVYKTTDGGQNWHRIWYGDNLARYIWISPEDHNLIYVSTGIFDREAANSDPVKLDPGGVGILRSRDGGESWEVLGPSNGIRADELYFGSLFMHPENPNILLAAAGNDPYMSALRYPLGAIYLTEDGGDYWERVLPLNNASVVEICASDPNIMYAGSINGVHRSQDGGHSWVETAGILWGSQDVLAGFPIDMQCDPRDPMRIFINNYIGGNFLSEDGGYTWQTASKGYTGALLRQVDVAVDNPALVYSASRMGTFVSRDGGENWAGTAFHPARSPEGILVAVDNFDSNHILAVLQDAGPDPKVSWDGGKSWSVVKTGLWEQELGGLGWFTNIWFSPYDPNLVLASAGPVDCYNNPGRCEAESGRGIFRSTDSGVTWSRTSLQDAHIFDLEIVNESVAFAAAYPGTLYRSEDGGQSWAIVSQDIVSEIPIKSSPDPDMIVSPIMVSVAVDPSNPQRIISGFKDGGVLISLDGGETWEISAAGLLPEISVTELIIDAMHPGVVYLGSINSGVYYSTDFGASWNVLNDGLTTRAVSDLTLSADGSVLYMASQGGGVSRLGNPVK